MTASDHRCADGRCVVCALGEPPFKGAEPPSKVASRRDAFPSLSLMSRPITPALPRIRWMGDDKYRCRVELHDIGRKKHTCGLSLSDYAAPAAEGWGNTPDRAYQAWKSKWRALFEPKQQ